MIDSLALSEAESKKLVEFAGDLARQDIAVLATLQELAGKPPCLQTGIMGRFGRAALKPIYELFANGGGELSRATSKTASGVGLRRSPR